MANRKVAEISRALRAAGIPPRFEDDEARLLMRMWRRLADGYPVRPEQVGQIAGNIQMPLDAATAFVSKLSERDDAGTIVGIMGLSQKNHPHRFEVDGRVLSTWCAWDSLFLPPLLGRDAKVESVCPATKTKVRLTISPEKIERREPDDASISVVVPEATQKSRDSVQEIWSAFCCQVHFFSSADAATEWFSVEAEAPVILSVEEGYELGRLAFAHFLESVQP